MVLYVWGCNFEVWLKLSCNAVSCLSLYLNQKNLWWRLTERTVVCSIWHSWSIKSLTALFQMFCTGKLSGPHWAELCCSICHKNKRNRKKKNKTYKHTHWCKRVVYILLAMIFNVWISVYTYSLCFISLRSHTYQFWKK